MTDDIFEAIAAGDVERVRALAAANPAVARRRDAQGASAVLHARYRGRLDLVEALLAAGQEPDVFEAAALGRLDRLRELLDLDPSLARAFAPDGFHPLGLAAFFGQPEAVRLLLERGAEVDAVARNPNVRTTALQAAAAAGDVESARLVLDAGADPNRTQAGGFAPLHSAAASGSEELARLLLDRGADRGARLDDGRTAAEVASAGGHAGLATLLS